MEVEDKVQRNERATLP